MGSQRGKSDRPRVGGDVRFTHPNGYRSGEWARVQHIYDHNGRTMMLVTFPDGDADWWPVDDLDAGYETRDPLCGGGA